MFSNAMKDCELYYDDTGENTANKQKSAIHDRYFFDNLHHLLIENSMSEEQMSDYIRMLKSKFKYYCLEYPFSNVSRNDYAAIEHRLDVSLIKSLTPRNENGEVLYIIPSKIGMYNQTVIL